MKTHLSHRMVSLLLVCCCIFSLSSTAMAKSENCLQANSILRYTTLKQLTPTLQIEDNTATCRANARSADLNYTIDLTVELQQQNGGWSTIQSWFASAKCKVELNAPYGIYQVHSGYTYRVKATAKVYNAGGRLLETAYAYSNEVSC